MADALGFGRTAFVRRCVVSEWEGNWYSRKRREYR
jgi:hypothetical protein